jgi:hypothetical protein
VVSQNGQLALLHHQIKAFTRIGAVTDDIAQANDLIDFLGRNIDQDRIQRFEVAVNIADECLSH